MAARLINPAAYGVLVLGAAGAAAYHLGFRIPLYVSLVAMMIVGATFLLALFGRRLGILITIAYLTFTLPFVHLLNYVDFDYSAPPSTFMWGLVANPYMFDSATIDLMALIAAVGSCALVGGAALSGASNRAMVIEVTKQRSTMLPFFFVWVAAAVALFWLSAPKLTIFEAAYTQSVSLSEQINFSSAWLVAQGLLAIALIDAIVEQSRRKAIVKLLSFLAALLISVIWFQLLRGNREGMPFVVIAGVLFVIWGAPRIAQRKGVRLLLQGAAVACVLVIMALAYVVGELRSTMVGGGVADLPSAIMQVVVDNPTLAPPPEAARDVDTASTASKENLAPSGASASDERVRIGPAIASHFPTSTWTAVLMTPLSVAGDDLRGLLELKLGSTYVDFLLSAVPGFIADSIGFERPIDATRGPAWEMRYGLGGTHATVVPFMNFRMAGVFLIILGWSWLLNTAERRMCQRDKVAGLSFIAIVGIAVPHWMWYGEKNIMTAVLVWAVLLLAYRLSVNRIEPMLFRSKAGTTLPFDPEQKRAPGNIGV